jgi:hypothetical protein
MTIMVATSPTSQSGHKSSSSSPQVLEDKSVTLRTKPAPKQPLPSPRASTIGGFGAAGMVDFNFQKVSHIHDRHVRTTTATTPSSSAHNTTTTPSSSSRRSSSSTKPTKTPTPRGSSTIHHNIFGFGSSSKGNSSSSKGSKKSNKASSGLPPHSPASSLTLPPTTPLAMAATTPSSASSTPKKTSLMGNLFAAAVGSVSRQNSSGGLGSRTSSFASLGTAASAASQDDDDDSLFQSIRDYPPLDPATHKFATQLLQAQADPTQTTLILENFITDASRHEIYALRDLLSQHDRQWELIQLNDTLHATHSHYRHRQFLYKKENIEHHLQMICFHHKIPLFFHVHCSTLELDLSDDEEELMDYLHYASKDSHVNSFTL